MEHKWTKEISGWTKWRLGARGNWIQLGYYRREEVKTRLVSRDGPQWRDVFVPKYYTEEEYQEELGLNID